VVTSGRGINREKWSMYFVYENRKMKSIEIVLKRRRGMRENDGGDESN
jgi:hypothetical protein